MFTGLIQSLGEIKAQDKARFVISISPPHLELIKHDLTLGDSVAVDGVCLTVEEVLLEGFLATASPETLKRTTLNKAQQSAHLVNLECSLRVGSKIGGHFVTGHVDSLGSLIRAVSTDSSWEIYFGAAPQQKEQWQKQITPYLVEKGSIAVNGISLTIAEIDSLGNWFKTAVIPHTYFNTNLHCLQPGDLVNIESDILGKYVGKFIAGRLPYQSSSGDISLDFLTENGYL